jgi:hypothetical protein
MIAPQKKFPVTGPDFAAGKIPDDLQARNLAQDPSAAGLLDRMRELHSTLRAQTVTIPSCFVRFISAIRWLASEGSRMLPARSGAGCASHYLVGHGKAESGT